MIAILACLSLQVDPPKEDPEKRKQLESKFEEFIKVVNKMESDPAAKKDPEVQKQKEALGQECDALMKELAGDDPERREAIDEELVKKYAPEKLEQMTAARKAANERNAVACLKSIVTAQENFKSNDLDRNNVNDYWTGDLAGLYCIELRSTGHAIGVLPDVTLASADAARLGKAYGPAASQYNAAHLLKHRPKSGYVYQVMTHDDTGADYATDTDGCGAVHNFGRYAFVATPAKHGTTGTYTFIVSETAVLYRKDNGGKPVTRWPDAATLEKEWERVR